MDETAGPHERAREKGTISSANAMTWKPVYALVKTIPSGQVATYGQVAKALKLRGGARAAGRALAACPAGAGIPWHRVVGAGGRLPLREPTSALQRKLLESEGMAVAGKRILDFSSHQWRPNRSRRPS
jgi:methylated-DNA-protein-cysteine methyltransferase related protein